MTPSTRLEPGALGIAYAAAFIAIGVLDALWLGWLAKDLYKEEMGALMADSPRIVPAAAFYLLYPLALVYLTLYIPPASFLEAVIRAAVVGLAAYGAYDLTNMAVIRGWSVKLSLIDLAWGTVASALAGAAAYVAVARTSG